ncbi:hypothetical protein CAEBREN_32490 [Caenorhabditis brenneri]|uniref:Exonuclease domain-containing protein n=1 Tax=Caenorhabditis brenneri TaxID=135651 RepID=G0P082_CAEBE|nr:hypothetical protein CAEBREN_32490 [Caenorhabditis brenneri]
MSPQEMHDSYSRFIIPEEILKNNGYLYFDNETSNRAQYKRDKWSAYTFMPDTDSTRKCTRCSRLFNRKSTFTRPNLCQYHPLKTELINGLRYHKCCSRRAGTSKGCQSHSFHVHQQPSESVLKEFVETPRPVSESDYRSNKVNIISYDDRCHRWASVWQITESITGVPVACISSDSFQIFGLDVEMIHTENGLEAARISLVDAKYRIMIDEFIKPEGKIVHLNTQFSGIEMDHLEHGKTLRQIHRLLFQYINHSSILIGHGLSNDLKVLHLIHFNVIDTGLLFEDENGKMFSLKKLAKHILEEDIQHGGHDSIEDATATLKIVEKLVHTDRMRSVSSPSSPDLLNSR